MKCYYLHCIGHLGAKHFERVPHTSESRELVCQLTQCKLYYTMTIDQTAAGIFYVQVIIYRYPLALSYCKSH